MSYRELLLGCGHRRDRLVDPYPLHAQNVQRLTVTARIVSEEQRWQDLVTVDLDPACDPDVVMDLSEAVWTTDRHGIRRRLGLFVKEDDCYVFASDGFDEVHAYEVLEHIGRQGDCELFFAQFDEIHRMLKHGGFLCATVPSRFSPWLWADPGHTRAILPETLVFLNRPHYQRWVGCSPSSDYRSMFEGDWDIVHSADDDLLHTFVLQAVKPPRKDPK